MTSLLDVLKAEYDLCVNHPTEYDISDLFSLRGDRRLISDYCPVRIVGKYDTALCNI